MTLPRKIMVPVDFGAQTESVLDYATALAAKLDARIHVLHVMGRPLYGAETGVVATSADTDALIARHQRELERLVTARVRRAAFDAPSLRFGDPRNEIRAEAAEAGIDLIVMGTAGRSGMARLVLGSVAELVVRTVHCPVLLVRADVEIDAEAKS